MTQDFRETKIKILSEEHSRAFQEAVIADGGGWSRGKSVVINLHKEFLFVAEDLRISYCDTLGFFKKHDYKEIQFLSTKGHVHAELMAQYAEDAKTHAEPWKLWQTKGDSHIWWDCRAHPMWWSDTEYRRKPKTKMIHGVEIPVFEFTPKVGEKYYAANVDVHEFFDQWLRSSECCVFTQRMIERGLIYPYTEEGKQAAILHSKIMLGIV